MKITDWVILFLAVLEAFLAVFELKDKMIFNSTFYQEELNKIMDNVTEEALKKGYTGDIQVHFEGLSVNKPVLDERLIVDTFMSKLSIMLYDIDNEMSRAEIWKNIAGMIIIDHDRYMVCDSSYSGEWLPFDSSIHENKAIKIQEILEINLEKSNYHIALPVNDGEYYSQTISDYSILVVYVMDEYHYAGNQYGGCILSGAAIKN